MKSFILAVSAAGATIALASTFAAAARRMSEDMCRPFTEQNRVACCAAENWQDLMQPWERGACQTGERNRNALDAPARQVSAPSLGNAGNPLPGDGNGGGGNGGGGTDGGTGGGSTDGGGTDGGPVAGCQGQGGGNCGVGNGGGGGNGTGNEGNGQGPGGNGNGPTTGNPGGQGGNSGNNH